MKNIRKILIILPPIIICTGIFFAFIEFKIPYYKKTILKGSN